MATTPTQTFTFDRSTSDPVRRARMARKLARALGGAVMAPNAEGALPLVPAPAMRGEGTHERPPLRGKTGAELFDRVPLVLPEFLFYPYYQRGTVTGTFGAGGANKTLVELSRQLSIVTLTNWAGIMPALRSPGRAIFVSKEMPERTIRGRIEAWIYGVTGGALGSGPETERARDELRKLIAENLYVLGRDSDGVQELYLTEVVRGTTVRVNQWAVDELRRLSDEHKAPGTDGVDDIYIETLNRLHVGGENDNAAAGTFIGALDKVVIGTGGAHVGTCGHAGKSPRDDQYIARGASAFSDNGRGTFGLVRNGNFVTFMHLKASEDGPEGPDLTFQREVWHPREGDERSYIYVRPVVEQDALDAAEERAVEALLVRAGPKGVPPRKLLHDSVRGGEGAKERRDRRARVVRRMEERARIVGGGEKGENYRLVA